MIRCIKSAHHSTWPRPSTTWGFFIIANITETATGSSKDPVSPEVAWGSGCPCSDWEVVCRNTCEVVFTNIGFAFCCLQQCSPKVLESQNCARNSNNKRLYRGTPVRAWNVGAAGTGCIAKLMHDHCREDGSKGSLLPTPQFRSKGYTRPLLETVDDLVSDQVAIIN